MVYLNARSSFGGWSLTEREREREREGEGELYSTFTFFCCMFQIYHNDARAKIMK